MIGVGEQSEFGNVFKMMCSEEVRSVFSVSCSFSLVVLAGIL